jgi:hypothetical protein
MVASPNVRRAHAKLEHRSNDQFVLWEGTGPWGPAPCLVASSHPHSEGAWGRGLILGRLQRPQDPQYDPSETYQHYEIE